MFARVHAMIVGGRALITPGELQGRGLAYAAVAIDDAFAESRGLDIRTGEIAQRPIFDRDGHVVGHEDSISPRDRLGNRRLLVETTGVLDANRGAQSQAQQIVLSISIGGATPVVVDVTPSTPKPEAKA